MSLRTRLTVGLALLVAVAASVAIGIAYATTADRLNAEIDTSLRQGGAALVDMPAGAGPFAAPGRQLFPGMGGHGPLGALGLVVVQYLDRVGNVTSTSGEVALPVEAADQTLARTGGDGWLHTVSLNGVTYRVLTQPLVGGGAVQLARDVSENQAVLSSLRWRYGLLDAAVVAVAAAGGWLFAQRVTGPLRRLTAASETVAATGQLDIAVESSRADETGRLARSFTGMLAALRQSRAQQRQLAQDAAHELRTPLTSLRANVDILRRHDTLPAPTRTRILNALDIELRELSTLVDELVELSTDQRDEEAPVPVALDRLARTVVTRAQQRSGRTITLDTEPCTVTGRSRALASALTNLIDNAIKFSPDTTVIEVSVHAGRVEVRDHGPGLSPQDLPHIFDRFYRSASARSQTGSGLGLAIVKHVAATHGGYAFATNHPAGGAIVGFHLPTPDAAAPLQEPTPEP